MNTYELIKFDFNYDNSTRALKLKITNTLVIKNLSKKEALFYGGGFSGLRFFKNTLDKETDFTQNFKNAIGLNYYGQRGVFVLINKNQSDVGFYGKCNLKNIYRLIEKYWKETMSDISIECSYIFGPEVLKLKGYRFLQEDEQVGKTDLIYKSSHNVYPFGSYNTPAYYEIGYNVNEKRTIGFGENPLGKPKDYIIHVPKVIAIRKMQYEQTHNFATNKALSEVGGVDSFLSKQVEVNF